MTKLDEQAGRMAERVSNYRAGEVPQPDTEHVLRWVSQFDKAAQLDTLAELNYVFESTYYTTRRIMKFLGRMAVHEPLTGKRSRSFWAGIQLMDIQRRGSSQRNMNDLLRKTINRQLGLEIGSGAKKYNCFVYLDDFSFTGNSIIQDLENWLKHTAPANSLVFIVLLAGHEYGMYFAGNAIRKAASQSRKQIKIRWHCGNIYENRVEGQYNPDVLWPVVIPQDYEAEAYQTYGSDFGFKPRFPMYNNRSSLYSNESARCKLEEHLLRAGARIRGFCDSPAPSLRPLGYGPFGFGFGSLLANDFNCPNTCPLALWWGEPDQSGTGPLSKWYPLLDRRTYDVGRMREVG